MSEDTKKVEETEQEANVDELSEKDLNNVAGGWSGSGGNGDSPMVVVKTPLESET